MAVGFLAAILLASSRAEKDGIEPQKIFDLCFYAMVSALVDKVAKKIYKDMSLELR